MTFTPEEVRLRNVAFAKASAEKNPSKVRANKAAYDERRRNDPVTWAKHMLCSIRGRCQKKGLPFDLTSGDILELIPPDRVCPAIGIPIIFGGKLSRNSPSIDRLVPARGYVRGNIVIISHKANSMKQDCIDPAELRRLADFVEQALGAQALVEESRRAA